MRISPGEIAFARMPHGPHSTARLHASWAIAAAALGQTRRAVSPASHNGASRFTASRRRPALGSTAVVAPTGPSIPVEQTGASIPLIRETAASASIQQPSWLERSACDGQPYPAGVVGHAALHRPAVAEGHVGGALRAIVYGLDSLPVGDTRGADHGACGERANTVMMRRDRSTLLRSWAVKVAKRRGSKRAMVALARRIGTILHQQGTCRDY